MAHAEAAARAQDYKASSISDPGGNMNQGDRMPRSNAKGDCPVARDPQALECKRRPAVLEFLEILSLQPRQNNLLRSASLDSLNSIEGPLENALQACTRLSLLDHHGLDSEGDRVKGESRVAQNCTKGTSRSHGSLTMQQDDGQLSGTKQCILLEYAHQELHYLRQALDTARGALDAAQKDLDCARIEMDGLRDYCRAHQLADAEMVRQLQREVHELQSAATVPQEIAHLRKVHLETVQMEAEVDKERPTPQERALLHDNRMLVEQLVQRQLQIAEVMEENDILQQRLRRTTFELKTLQQKFPQD